MPDSGYLCIFSKITIFNSKYRMQNKQENRSRRFSEDTECKKALIKKKMKLISRKALENFFTEI